MTTLSSRAVLLLLLSLVLLSGCSKMTRFEAPEEGSRLELLGRSGDALPRSEKLSSKSTGQHEFRAISADGREMHGILPLSVNGGKMAASILLFAPALFIGGFRDVFPYYEIDPVEQVIRYRNTPDEEWRIYVPSSAEKDRARNSFAEAKQ